MKVVTYFTKAVGREVAETKASLLAQVRKVRKLTIVCIRVFEQPVNTLYGVISAVLSVFLAFWFANIGIIQTAFTSTSLSLYDKFDFLFSMTGTLLRNLAPLQVTLIVVHLLLWCFVGAFWIEALKIHNERPRLRPAFGPTIIATLFIGTVAIIGISLVTPVITRNGISVFVSDHFSGTILLGGAIIAETVLLKKFSILLARTGKNY